MDNKKEKLYKIGMFLLFPAVMTLIQVVFLGVAAYNGRAGLYMQVAAILWLILILLYALALFFTRSIREHSFSFATILLNILNISV